MPLSALRASTKPRTTSSIVPPAREWNWEPRRSARVGSRPGDRTRSRGLGHWPALPGTPVPQSQPPSGPASAAHLAADSAAAPQPPLPPTERNAVSPGSVRKQPQDWSQPMLGQRRLLGGAPLLDLAPVFPPGTRSWLGRHTAAKPARGRGSGGPGGRHEQSPPCLGASSNCTATCHPVQSPPAPRHGHGGYNSHKTGQLRPREVKRRSPAPRP